MLRNSGYPGTRGIPLPRKGNAMSETILKLDHITKVYHNGTVANRDISVDFKKGEIHSIVGENGAGKSTLMKIIFGIENASDGTVTYKGQEVHFSSSMDAIKAGIGMVHQHFMLIPSLTVAQNIVLGMEPTKSGMFIDYKTAVEKTRALNEKYNFDVDVTKKVSELSVGEKQKVEILKTLYRNAEVIILDEPTSVLTPQETEKLFRELEGFREAGHTILFISHKLNEVKQISDRITVMRNGESRGTYNNADITLDDLTSLIIGRELVTGYDDKKTEQKDSRPILRVENIEKVVDNIPVLKGVSFTVKSGEILGIAGVQGNGQDHLIRAITGLSSMNGGKILLDGKDITKLSIKKKRQSGIAYIPEDRMEDGSALEGSVSDNIVSTYYDREPFSGKAFIHQKQIDQEADRLIKTFSVKTQSNKTKVGSLSGGNIQKVVVAREYNTHPLCMIAEQPTHGIDIGSAEFIHMRLIDMRNAGAAVLLVSADLDEIMSLSDRILVVYDGQIVGYFNSLKGLTREELGYYMLGVKRHTDEELGGALND